MAAEMLDRDNASASVKRGMAVENFS